MNKRVALASADLPRSSSSAELRSRAYRPDVDGLRSLAILSVVLYHAGVRAVSGGFTGVDVFFGISGYLIGGHITSELKGGIFSFLNFYRNRAKRILPALYSVLCIVLAIGLVLLSPHELTELAKYTAATTASASNILFWKTTGYFGPDVDHSPLLMTWSLGVEEQFYLVIPVLLVLVYRTRRQFLVPMVVVVSGVSFLASTHQVTHSRQAAFYLLTSRAWELGLGVVLAVCQVEGRRISALQTRIATEGGAWLGLILVMTSFFAISSKTVFPGPAALPSVTGTCLLLASSGAWVNKRLLSLSPLVLIGRVSYSFYLFHWPLLVFLRIAAGKGLSVFWCLGMLVVALGLAVLSYHFVEKPFRSSNRPASALLLRYVVVSAILLLVSVALYLAKGLPERYPLAAAVDRVVDAKDSPSQDLCLVSNGVKKPNFAAACVLPLGAGPSIALWGDSHASAVAGQLRAIAKQQGFAMEEYAKTSCPPLHGVGRMYRSEPSALDDCVFFNDMVFHRLLAETQVKIVVLEAYWVGAFNPDAVGQGRLAVRGDNSSAEPTTEQSQALLHSSLSATVTALIQAKKEVVVLGDAPAFAVDPIWRMRTRLIPLRSTLYEWFNSPGSVVDPGVDHAADDTPQQAAERRVLRETTLSLPGVRFLDTRALFCGEANACIYRVSNVPLFVDTNHLSAGGAARVLDGFDPTKH